MLNGTRRVTAFHCGSRPSGSCVAFFASGEVQQGVYLELWGVHGLQVAQQRVR